MSAARDYIHIYDASSPGVAPLAATIASKAVDG